MIVSEAARQPQPTAQYVQITGISAIFFDKGIFLRADVEDLVTVLPPQAAKRAVEPITIPVSLINFLLDIPSPVSFCFIFFDSFKRILLI
jgi:hypothetical protein